MQRDPLSHKVTQARIVHHREQLRQGPGHDCGCSCRVGQDRLHQADQPAPVLRLDGSEMVRELMSQDERRRRVRRDRQEHCVGVGLSHTAAQGLLHRPDLPEPGAECRGVLAQEPERIGHGPTQSTQLGSEPARQFTQS